MHTRLLRVLVGDAGATVPVDISDAVRLTGNLLNVDGSALRRALSMELSYYIPPLATNQDGGECARLPGPWEAWSVGGMHAAAAQGFSLASLTSPTPPTNPNHTRQHSTPLYLTLRSLRSLHFT